jgi:hypothetical protein
MNDFDDDAEYSPGGSRIYRYEEDVAEGPLTLPPPSEDLPFLEDHISRHLGPVEMVFHELISDKVHIDVHWTKPNGANSSHVMVTTGMSDLPMNVVPGAERYRHAELAIHLPANWPLTEDAFQDERNYWPIRLLKFLARFPHLYNTWLGPGHTVPNGDPPAPLDNSVGFVCALIIPPLALPPGFHVCRLDEEKTVYFYSVIPVYLEEMDFKLEKGVDELVSRFRKHGVTDLVEPGRRNVAKRRFWPFG